MELIFDFILSHTKPIELFNILSVLMEIPIWTLIVCDT